MNITIERDEIFGDARETQLDICIRCGLFSMPIEFSIYDIRFMYMFYKHVFEDLKECLSDTKALQYDMRESYTKTCDILRRYYNHDDEYGLEHEIGNYMHVDFNIDIIMFSNIFASSDKKGDIHVDHIEKFYLGTDDGMRLIKGISDAIVYELQLMLRARHSLDSLFFRDNFPLDLFKLIYCDVKQYIFGVGKK